MSEGLSKLELTAIASSKTIALETPSHFQRYLLIFRLATLDTTNAVGTEIYRPTTATPSASPRLDIFALGIIACELLCKFDTQMERRQTLQSLRQCEFPKKFASCAGHQSAKVRDCVSDMLSGDADNMPTIPDLKKRLSDVLAQSQKLEVNEVLRRSST